MKRTQDLVAFATGVDPRGGGLYPGLVTTTRTIARYDDALEVDVRTYDGGTFVRHTQCVESSYAGYGDEAMITGDFAWIGYGLDETVGGKVTAALTRLVQEAGSRRVVAYDSEADDYADYHDNAARPVALAIALARAGLLEDALSGDLEQFKDIACR